MNVILGWFAGKPRWAVDVAIWALLLGLWAATLIRAGEILRDEDMPLTLKALEPTR